MNRNLASLALLTFVGATAACSSYSYDDDPTYYPRLETPKPTSTATARPTKGPQPAFGPTVRAENPPPPLSGGTLAVLRDGSVVAADPDRDKVFVVKLDSREVRTLTLALHDEPGRVVEDTNGLVHVVLRQSGKIATIDPVTAQLLAKRDVCPAPRGIAIDGANAIVACEGGELLALPVDPKNTTVTPLATLDRDLRDVVITAKSVFVSRMRSAEVIELTRAFAVVSRSKPRFGGSLATRVATQAMRMIAAPEGDTLGEPILVHQMARNPTIGSADPKTTPPYYGPPVATDTCVPGSAGPIVLTAVSRPGLEPQTARAPDLAALPVDVAADGTTIAIVAAGNAHTPSLPQIYTMARRTEGSPPPSSDCFQGMKKFFPSGEAVAVAFRRPNALIVQSREPATLELLPEGTLIPLSEESRADTGHAIFHANSGIGMACASCHPEGGEDGRTWTLDATGPVRTSTLRGTLVGTAPFHWRGDVPDFETLSERVMTSRMNGPALGHDQIAALESWLGSIPAAKSARPSAASERGRELFARSDVGCASCHQGALFTSAGNHEVRSSGDAFQVPSLAGVGAHAPFFHDGCASQLGDLRCGGKVHDVSTKLDAAGAADLAAYLETL